MTEKYLCERCGYAKYSLLAFHTCPPKFLVWISDWPIESLEDDPFQIYAQDEAMAAEKYVKKYADEDGDFDIDIRVIPCKLVEEQELVLPEQNDLLEWVLAKANVYNVSCKFIKEYDVRKK